MSSTFYIVFILHLGSCLSENMSVLGSMTSILLLLNSHEEIVGLFAKWAGQMRLLRLFAFNCSLLVDFLMSDGSKFHRLMHQIWNIFIC